eukprot:2761444-Pyramimonas_sp.AAC.2
MQSRECRETCIRHDVVHPPARDFHTAHLHEGRTEVSSERSSDQRALRSGGGGISQALRRRLR